MSDLDPYVDLSASEAADAERGAFYQNIKEIGPYELTRLIGSGGMSRVYHGRHKRTGQEVAVKVLRPEMLERKHVVRRFHSEFRAARKLIHPHLVRALDFGMDQGLPYLALEYIAGQSLFEMMRAKLRLPEVEAVRLIRQTAEGLRIAHQMNVIHRDIKPANILITAEGNAKLSDLGLAKDLLAAESITRSGASLGTLHYMAPEQFLNARKADARADLYSLAVTLYHVLTGRLPFSGGQMTMLQKKKTNQFVPPRAIVPALSIAVNRLIVQAMRANPDERPPTCGDFLSQLDVVDSPLPATMPSIDLAPVASAPNADNRRVENRFPTSLRGSCTVLMSTQKETWKGQVVDISAGGANVLVDRRFEIGSLVAVDVDDEQLDEPLSFTLRVTWVRPGELAGSWNVGGKFHRRMPHSELQRLLQRELGTVLLHES
jgi:serine/threonine protein kinase